MLVCEKSIVPPLTRRRTYKKIFIGPHSRRLEGVDISLILLFRWSCSCDLRWIACVVSLYRWDLEVVDCRPIKVFQKRKKKKTKHMHVGAPRKNSAKPTIHRSSFEPVNEGTSLNTSKTVPLQFSLTGGRCKRPRPFTAISNTFLYASFALPFL